MAEREALMAEAIARWAPECGGDGMRLALKERDAVTEESQSGCAQNDADGTGGSRVCAARVGHVDAAPARTP